MAPSAPASSWRKNLAKCFVLWVGICHGGWAVVGRDVTKNSSDFRPLFVATARNFGGFCLLFLIALIRDRGIVWPQQKDLSRIVAAGVCDAFIGQVRRRDATRLLPSCGVKGEAKVCVQEKTMCRGSEICTLTHTTLHHHTTTPPHHHKSPHPLRSTSSHSCASSTGSG